MKKSKVQSLKSKVGLWTLGIRLWTSLFDLKWKLTYTTG